MFLFSMNLKGYVKHSHSHQTLSEVCCRMIVAFWISPEPLLCLKYVQDATLCRPLYTVCSSSGQTFLKKTEWVLFQNEVTPKHMYFIKWKLNLKIIIIPIFQLQRLAQNRLHYRPGWHSYVKWQYRTTSKQALLPQYSVSQKNSQEVVNIEKRKPIL